MNSSSTLYRPISRITPLLLTMLLMALASVTTHAQLQDKAEAGDYWGLYEVAGDFNGDGYSDLAVSGAYEDIGTLNAAGAVNVIYGSASGLNATSVPNQFLRQGAFGIPDMAEANDFFGSAMATGDFNGDGYDDLAIGAGAEDVGSLVDAGAVIVVYGGVGGLRTYSSQYFDQNSPGVPDTAEAGDRFGASLAAGDLNGDGYDDLAIGVPTEDVDGAVDAGAVNVIYGSGGGLFTGGGGLPLSQFWTQNSGDIEDMAETGDQFGFRVAIGNFDSFYAPFYHDLAIGVPYEDIMNIVDAGAVNVIYGSAGGLSATASVPDQFWHQDVTGVLDMAEAGDNFGARLAAGDLDGTYDDLAIGVPREDIDGIVDAGAVVILYGSSPNGLHTAFNRFLRQGAGGVLDVAETNDRFGNELVMGNFAGPISVLGGHNLDLAVSVPFEDINGIVDAGAVNVIYSSGANQFWHQDSPDVEDMAEPGDQFGSRLAAGDFNGKCGVSFCPPADLVIGVYLEDVETIKDAGAVNVIYGSYPFGLSPTQELPDQFWHQGN